MCISVNVFGISHKYNTFENDISNGRCRLKRNTEFRVLAKNVRCVGVNFPRFVRVGISVDLFVEIKNSAEYQRNFYYISVIALGLRQSFESVNCFLDSRFNAFLVLSEEGLKVVVAVCADTVTDIEEYEKVAPRRTEYDTEVVNSVFENDVEHFCGLFISFTEFEKNLIVAVVQCVLGCLTHSCENESCSFGIGVSCRDSNTGS